MTTRQRARFAWLPVRLSDGSWYWLTPYLATQDLRPVDAPEPWGSLQPRWVVTARHALVIYAHDVPVRDVVRTRWLCRVNGRWRWRVTVLVRERFEPDESGWAHGHWVPIARTPLDEALA